MNQFIDLLSLLLCCCCAPLFFFIALIFGIIDISRIRISNKDVPNILTRLWYRTFLLTPRGIIVLFLSIFTIWLAKSSVAVSTLSSIGIFFLVIMGFVWFFAQIINFYLLVRKLIQNKELINSKINYRILEENDAIKQYLKMDLPQPLGFLLKIRVIIPSSLGKDLRVTGLEANQVELIPQYSKRGEYELGPVIIEYSDLFGLISILLLHKKEEKLQIVPQIKHISKLAWAAPTKKHGDDISVKKIVNSDELYDIKKYVRGDDVRRIHWKLSARKNELMMRKPELSYVSVGEFLIIIDNQIPFKSGVGDFLEIKGTDDLLDRMVSTAGSILDYAGRFKTPVKVFYFNKKGKLMRIDPIQSRRDKWLLQLAQVSWVKSKTDSFKINLDKSKIDNIGFFMLTSEINVQRFETIKSTLQVQGANIIYFPPDSYIQFENDSKGKDWKSKISRVFLSKSDYSQQTTFAENIKNFFFKKSKKIKSHRKKYLIKKTNEIKSFLKKNFSDYKEIKKKDDFVRILEIGK